MSKTTSLNRSIDHLADEVEKCNQRQEASLALWGLCEKFVRDNQISCAESVYQSDRVIENGYELIAKICGIVGFHKED